MIVLLFAFKLNSPLAVGTDDVCVSLSVVDSIETAWTMVAESDSSTKVFINDYDIIH